MELMIESISYPCHLRIETPTSPVFGVAMKSYIVGQSVLVNYNEASIVSAIAPAEGGGYAVTFEDGRQLFVKDHPMMEVLYKPLEEEDGDKQNDTDTASV
jgi:hypothetical protein